MPAMKQRRKLARRQPFPGIELRGKTAVVIGCGGIGTQIALRANAFGMKVIGVDPEDKPFMPFFEKIVKPDQLDEVVPLADVVFISAPHTQKSHKMMGMHEFELMKKNSYFIAVSRGGIYEMPGLVKALDSQAARRRRCRRDRSGAAAQRASAMEVRQRDRHAAHRRPLGPGQRAHGRHHQGEHPRFVEGKPLINVVDKQKGY